MAKSKLSRYSIPAKIEPPKSRMPRTTRKDWQKLIQTQLQLYKKANNKAMTRGLVEAFDYDGAFADRRAEAMLNTLEAVYERYKLLRDEGENPNELGEEWIDLNLPFTSYAAIETQSHILFAAAVWILDRITPDSDKRLAMYRFLPDDDYALEDVYAPDVWDCQHDYDLITSVQYVLHYRNADKAGIEEDGQGNEKVITDRITAAGAQRTGLPCREAYEGLISLIPKADIEKAIQNFESCFWAWSDRYFACVRPLEQDIAACEERLEALRLEYNAGCDELAAAMEALDKRFRERSKAARNPNRSTKPNPLMMNPMDISAISPLTDTSHTRLPFSERTIGRDPIESDPMFRNALSLSEKMDRLDERFDEEAERLRNLSEKKQRFALRMTRQGRIFHRECMEDFGEAVADAMTELSISDPYELCFALIYLIDQGSDLPWLYGVGTGLMEEVTESLPWGIIEYDEMDDEIWDDEPVAAKPSAIPDWYERRFHKKGKDIVDFPRSLAQIVYEETGCLMPRDMHLYDSRVKELGRYGIRGKEALTLLSCMTALGYARRSNSALNFKPELLDLMLNDDEPITSASAAETADDVSEQISSLRDEIKRLKDALHTADRASRDAKKELAAVKEKAALEHRELADLRELVFKNENDEGRSEETTNETLFPHDIQKDTLVFGGHDTWQKAIKPLLHGNIRFIDRDLVFDTSIIRNVDVVWVQSNAISHKQYYRVVDTARQYNKPVRYFTYSSAAKCAEQLMENDMA